MGGDEEGVEVSELRESCWTDLATRSKDLAFKKGCRLGDGVW